MSQSLIKEKLAEDVEGAKAKKYEELQEQFVDGDISEDEFDEKLDELFESGDEFLDHEPESEPIVDTSNLFFRMKEIGEIIVAFGAIAVFFYALYITKGIILPLTIPLGAVIILYYMGAFR